jgi:acyl-CoA thioester hydrolase
MSTTAVELSPASNFRIRFQDCDPFGHLNNARYMDYFLEARFEHLREHYDLNVHEFGAREGKSWVVTGSRLAYVEPVRVDETVRIVTRLILVGPNRIHNEGVMYDASGERLKSLAWIQYAFVDIHSGRLARHAPEQLRWLQSLIYSEGPDTYEDFDRRARMLRQTRAPVPS